MAQGRMNGAPNETLRWDQNAYCNSRWEGTSGEEMVNKLDLQTFSIEFKSYWVPRFIRLSTTPKQKSYTEYIEGLVSPYECPVYDTK